MTKAIKKRIAQDKQAVLEHLKKTPIVQLAVKNAGVGRTTYYTWCKQDKKFAQAAQEALYQGRLFVNDIAESQLVALIKDKKIEAIRLWLRHHHPSYTEKLEIKGTIKHEPELTKEQKRLVRQALRLTNINKKIYEQGKKSH